MKIENRMNKITKTILIALIIILVGVIIISGFIISSGKKTKSIIDDFKSRGELVFTYDGIEYYKVVKEFEYEDTTSRIYSTSSIFDEAKYFTDNKIGTTGDVYITSNDPFGTFYTKWASKRIKIGHCGIVYDENADTMVEVYGNKVDNIVSIHDNDWNEQSKGELIVIRKKEPINKKEVINWLDSKMGMKYNYLFFINPKNRYYCTSLVSKCYEESQTNSISNNNIFVTGASMINNDNTYIIYYKERVNDSNIKYKVYFLSEE